MDEEVLLLLESLVRGDNDVEAAGDCRREEVAVVQVFEIQIPCREDLVGRQAVTPLVGDVAVKKYFHVHVEATSRLPA